MLKVREQRLVLKSLLREEEDIVRPRWKKTLWSTSHPFVLWSISALRAQLLFCEHVAETSVNSLLPFYAPEPPNTARQSLELFRIWRRWQWLMLPPLICPFELCSPRSVSDLLTRFLPESSSTRQGNLRVWEKKVHWSSNFYQALNTSKYCINNMNIVFFSLLFCALTSKSGAWLWKLNKHHSRGLWNKEFYQFIHSPIPRFQDSYQTSLNSIYQPSLVLYTDPGSVLENLTSTGQLSHWSCSILL